MNTTRSWYIKTKSGAAGPYTFEMLRSFVEAEKLPENAMLSESRNGPWFAAGDMEDLFHVDIKPSELVPDVVKNAASSAAKAAGTAATSTAIALVSATKSIAEYSKKKTEERRQTIVAKQIETEERERQLEANRTRYFSQPDPVPEAPKGNVHVHVHVNQSVNMANMANAQTKRWDKNIAVALSLIIPGLGQMYKGQILNGLLWLIIVVAGYAFFIFPGLILHLFCLLGASHGDEYR